MLTPDDLRKMTAEDRTALFEQLCHLYYGERLTRPAVAADFDVTRETVYRWIQSHNVPWSVLFTLERWIHSEARAEKIIQDWGTIPAQLAEAAGTMSRVASTLARIARLSGGPGASADSADASPPPAPESAQ